MAPPYAAVLLVTFDDVSVSALLRSRKKTPPLVEAVLDVKLDPVSAVVALYRKTTPPSLPVAEFCVNAQPIDVSSELSKLKTPPIGAEFVVKLVAVAVKTLATPRRTAPPSDAAVFEVKLEPASATVLTLAT
eukprot:3940558-Rhodomonas_salina.2